MDEKEELVKKALFSFVRKQVPTAQLRYRSFFFISIIIFINLSFNQVIFLLTVDTNIIQGFHFMHDIIYPCYLPFRTRINDASYVKQNVALAFNIQ